MRCYVRLIYLILDIFERTLIRNRKAEDDSSCVCVEAPTEFEWRLVVYIDDMELSLTKILNGFTFRRY